MPDVVYLWTGKIVIWLWLTIVLGIAGEITRRWLLLRVRAWRLRRGWVRDTQGTPRSLTEPPYQRDEGDESDVVAEGGFCAAWPGIAAIDAIKHANPRLSDMQAHAVAVARSRRVQA